MMTSDDARPRYAVLISGRGSNLRAILEADLPAQCVGVVSSRADAGGLRVASQRSLPTRTLTRDELAARDDYDAALTRQLTEWDAQWVVLAGFMRILGDAFLARWTGRVVNIHPSLLPAFPGLHPHRQALAAGVARSGCTVHFVEPGAVDSGRVIAAAGVPVLPDDDEHTLAARILDAEHRLYPATLRQLFSPG